MTQLAQVASPPALERWMARLQAAIDERPVLSDEREGLQIAKEWFEEECFRGRCGVAGPGSMRCVLRAGHPPGWHDNGGAAWLTDEEPEEESSPVKLVGSRARDRCEATFRSLRCEKGVGHGESHTAVDSVRGRWQW
jgi:hypothetical protein